MRIELGCSLSVHAMLFWWRSLNELGWLVFSMGLFVNDGFELVGRRSPDLRSVRRIVIKVWPICYDCLNAWLFLNKGRRVIFISLQCVEVGCVQDVLISCSTIGHAFASIDWRVQISKKWWKSPLLGKHGVEVLSVFKIGSGRVSIRVVIGVVFP